jgi:hypothetical protein
MEDNQNERHFQAKRNENERKMRRHLAILVKISYVYSSVLPSFFRCCTMNYQN